MLGRLVPRQTQHHPSPAHKTSRLILPAKIHLRVALNLQTTEACLVNCWPQMLIESNKNTSLAKNASKNRVQVNEICCLISYPGHLSQIIIIKFVVALMLSLLYNYSLQLHVLLSLSSISSLSLSLSLSLYMYLSLPASLNTSVPPCPILSPQLKQRKPYLK